MLNYKEVLELVISILQMTYSRINADKAIVLVLNLGKYESVNL